jgi:hypothetical protein
MTTLYLIGRKNTGAALFNNSQKIPYPFTQYQNARSYLYSTVLVGADQLEPKRWFIKKYETAKPVIGQTVYAVCSQRLGRGAYQGESFMIAVCASESEANEYIKINSPQTLLGKFFAEYRLIVQKWNIR